jgi:hypothetical protein
MFEPLLSRPHIVPEFGRAGRGAQDPDPAGECQPSTNRLGTVALTMPTIGVSIMKNEGEGHSRTGPVTDHGILVTTHPGEYLPRYRQE